MSATEIFMELEKLPANEQEELLVRLSDTLRARARQNGSVKYAVDSEFEKIADQVFRENDNLFRRLAQ